MLGAFTLTLLLVGNQVISQTKEGTSAPGHFIECNQCFTHPRGKTARPRTSKSGTRSLQKLSKKEGSRVT
jgi:hypothetical protein